VQRHLAGLPFDVNARGDGRVHGQDAIGTAGPVATGFTKIHNVDLTLAETRHIGRCARAAVAGKDDPEGIFAARRTGSRRRSSLARAEIEFLSLVESLL